MKVKSTCLESSFDIPENKSNSRVTCVDVSCWETETFFISTTDISSGPEVCGHRIYSHSQVSGDSEIELALPPHRIGVIQQLPSERLLIKMSVSGARYESGANHLGSAFVVCTKSGRKSTLSIGEGVSDIQTSEKGHIWIGYSDSGIFATSRNGPVIGESGLIAMDSRGQVVFEFQPPNGFDRVADCYAMNVAPDQTTWMSYYPGFPIVKIENSRVVQYWKSPLTPVANFAVSVGRVLIHRRHKGADEFHLFKIENNGSLQKKAIFSLVDTRSRKIKIRKMLNRAGNIYLVSDSAIYRVAVEELIGDFATN